MKTITLFDFVYQFEETFHSALYEPIAIQTQANGKNSIVLVREDEFQLLMKAIKESPFLFEYMKLKKSNKNM